MRMVNEQALLRGATICAQPSAVIVTMVIMREYGNVKHAYTMFVAMVETTQSVSAFADIPK